MKSTLVVSNRCIRVRRPARIGSRSASPHDKSGIIRRYRSTVFAFKMAAALIAFFASTANAAGDPERGARAFQACMICHSVNAGEHSTGPSLANLMSRKAGTAEGFAQYSQALKDTNVIWNENSLDRWLSGPRRFIPGTSMAVPGIGDAQARADVIAYLKAVSENMAPAMPKQSPMAGTPYRRSR